MPPHPVRPLTPLVRCLLPLILAVLILGAARWLPQRSPQMSIQEAGMPSLAADIAPVRQEAAEALIRRLETQVRQEGMGRVTPLDITVLRGLLHESSQQKQIPSE